MLPFLLGTKEKLLLCDTLAARKITNYSLP